jgi:hypothetical protein
MTKIIGTESAPEGSSAEGDVVPKNLKPGAAWQPLGYEKMSVKDAESHTSGSGSDLGIYS